MFALSRDLLPGDRAEARISGRRFSSVFSPWPPGEKPPESDPDLIKDNLGRLLDSTVM